MILDSDPFAIELRSLGYSEAQIDRAVERAAILQYDAGEPRASAEWHARRAVGKCGKDVGVVANSSLPVAP